MSEEQSKCHFCNQAFVEGNGMQAFLRSPDDEAGSWTRPIRIDGGFQARFRAHPDEVMRKHISCEGSCADMVSITIERKKLITITADHGGYLCGKCVVCGNSGWIDQIEHSDDCPVKK